LRQGRLETLIYLVSATGTSRNAERESREICSLLDYLAPKLLTTGKSYRAGTTCQPTDRQIELIM